MAETSSSVRSLDALKAKLKARQQPDLSTSPRFEHKGAETIFVIRPMSGAGYHEVEAADFPDESVGKWPLKDQIRFKENRRNRAYLLYGCCLEDGTALDEESVGDILSGPWGADNKALVSEIQRANPPREIVVQEIRAAIGASTMTLVLFRILKEAGALEKLRDWLLADEDSADAQELSADLGKWLECLDVFEGFLNASDLATQFEMGVYKRRQDRLSNVEDE